MLSPWIAERSLSLARPQRGSGFSKGAIRREIPRSKTWCARAFERGPVRFIGDGLGLSGLEQAQLVLFAARGSSSKPLVTDSYSRGGAVEEVEKRFADALGKERAVFMPTGTLANHLAMRALAGERRRVIVPHESHIYNDTGDAAQTLSNLTLLPLGPGAATFSLQPASKASSKRPPRVASRPKLEPWSSNVRSVGKEASCSNTTR